MDFVFVRMDVLLRKKLCNAEATRLGHDGTLVELAHSKGCKPSLLKLCTMKAHRSTFLLRHFALGMLTQVAVRTSL